MRLKGMNEVEFGVNRVGIAAFAICAIAGVATTAAAVLVAGVCGVGVLIVENNLATPQEGGHPPSEHNLGYALTGGTVLGVAGVLTGGTLWILGLSE